MNLIRGAKSILKHPSLLPHVLQGRYEFNMKSAQAEFQECLNRAKALHIGMKSDDLVKLCGRLPDSRIAFSYALCRQFKPEIAVETGVWYGYSTGYVLQALHDNDKGELYSVDLPNVTYALDAKYKLSGERQATHSLPQGMPSGFAVPQRLRGRWDLRLGDAKVELPKLLEELGRVDF